MTTGRLASADRVSGLEIAEFSQLSEMVSRIAANGKMPKADPEAW